MAECGNCGAALDPRWKFCIHCGTRVEPRAVEQIPGAIRPADAAPPAKRRLGWQLALGLAIAAIGAAMVVYLVLVLIVPHAR